MVWLCITASLLLWFSLALHSGEIDSHGGVVYNTHGAAVLDGW